MVKIFCDNCEKEIKGTIFRRIAPWIKKGRLELCKKCNKKIYSESLIKTYVRKKLEEKYGKSTVSDASKRQRSS